LNQKSDILPWGNTYHGTRFNKTGLIPSLAISIKRFEQCLLGLILLTMKENKRTTWLGEQTDKIA